MYSALIIFFLFAIIFSFLCSLWEAVLLSITPTYAQIKLREGTFIGRKLKYFKENIDKPLAAILTVNTIAHTVGAIGVGEQAALIWAHTSPVVTMFVVPIVMTLAILLLSEIIPKTIGANYWETFASFTVYSLTFLIKILYPLVWVCQLITKGFRRKKNKNIFTRSDFLALAEIGEQQGIFEESEADLIEKALDLHEIRVRDVMRSAKEMVMVNKGESIETLLAFIKEHKYTRYPVFDKDKAEIVGIIHVKDLFSRKSDSTHFDDYIRPVLKAAQHLPLKSLLNRFRAGMPHFALVYKGKKLAGFITLDNVLQVFLGMIKDEFHRTHVDWNMNDDGTISANGRCSVYALEQILDKDIDVEEDVETLAGLILHELKSIPEEGESIEFTDFTAVVEKMDGARILAVKVYPKRSGL